jgi:hypothetical protein
LSGAAIANGLLEAQAELPTLPRSNRVPIVGLLALPPTRRSICDQVPSQLSALQRFIYGRKLISTTWHDDAHEKYVVHYHVTTRISKPNNRMHPCVIAHGKTQEWLQRVLTCMERCVDLVAGLLNLPSSIPRALSIPSHILWVSTEPL